MKLLVFSLLAAVASAATVAVVEERAIPIYGTTPTDLAKEVGTDYLSTLGPVTHRFLSTRDLLENPIFVFAPAQEHPDFWNSYFAYHGLRSIKSDESFRHLFDYFKGTQDLVGLVFYPKAVFNARFLESVVYKNFLPHNFKVSDYIKAVDHMNEVPILLVLPREHFERFHFTGFSEVAKLGVYDDVIEAHGTHSTHEAPQVIQTVYVTKSVA